MKSKKAFTLIELLVVIAIIGILATISVLALNNARAKSRDAKRAGNMKQVQTALELFFNDKQRYPTTEEWNTGKIYSTSTNSTSTYMQIIPIAPTPADGTCGDKNIITYTPSSDWSSYSISFCLGGTTGTLTPGTKCLTPAGIVDVDCSSGGEELAVDGQPCPGTPTVTVTTLAGHTCNTGAPDYDTCLYNTVQIGTQCWMKENLNVGTIVNGSATQGNYSSGLQKYCYDLDGNLSDYTSCQSDGALYQWHMAVGKDATCDSYDCGVNPNNVCCTVTGDDVCPAGWHVPTDSDLGTPSDWRTLEQYISGNPSCDSGNDGCPPVGDKLKKVVDCSIPSGPNCGTYGFNISLAGNRRTDASFFIRGYYAYLWSSLPYSGFSRARQLGASYAEVYRNYYDRAYGLSVRCVQD